MEQEILFRQINMHRAREASFQLNNVIASNPAICMLTEPFTAFGRVANIPHNHKCLPATALVSRPRAAILVPRHLNVVHLEHLSHPDMTVALLNTARGKILLASIYLDSKKAVVQPWLQKLMEYGDSKKYPLLLALDSNAHSELYGPDTNERGEKFEEFILNHNLKVENIGEDPTYHAFRRGAGIGTCIDVTLTRGLVPLVNWKVLTHEYNGSDHHTLSWSLPITTPPPAKIRPWKSAKWEIFQKELSSFDFDAPVNFTPIKVDKFLDRIYKHIQEALDKACPLRDAKATPIEIKWFGNDQNTLQNRTKRKYKAYQKHTDKRHRKAFLRAKRIYMRSCRRAKHASWREFVEKTPDEKSMAKLIRIAQRKENRSINTLLNDDNTLTAPGTETIMKLAETHFPAATQGTENTKHSSKHKIPTTEI